MAAINSCIMCIDGERKRIDCSLPQLYKCGQIVMWQLSDAKNSKHLK